MENLIEQLTAKNSEYVHAITKQLMLVGKSDEEVKAILDEILPQIIEGQKSGILARKLLGTPTEFTSQYEEKKTKAKEKVATEKNESPVLMWLDGALLFFGFISLFNGVMGIFEPKRSLYGLLTTMLASVLAGLVLYFMYKNFYSENAEKKTWKTWVLMIVAVVAWVGVFSLSVFIPASINIVPPAYVVLIIGAIAIAVRYVLQKKFNVQSAMSRPSRN